LKKGSKKKFMEIHVKFTRLKSILYIYRLDILAILFMFLGVLIFLHPIFREGHIVFSDIAFGFSSRRYMDEIFGAWNERYSTSTLLNSPRLFFILPLYGLSIFGGYDGGMLIKTFICSLVFMAIVSMYLLIKRLVSIYFSKHFDFYEIFAITTGAMFYGLNPWVIQRIQHIYLLCGYALFPVVLMLFFNIFDPKFQGQLIEDYNMKENKVYLRNWMDIFLFAIIFTISTAAIHYFFFGAVYLSIVSVLLMIKNIILLKDIKKILLFLRNYIKKIIIVGVVFLMFSGYWFFSYVASIIFGAQVSQHNVNVVDTLSLFSRNSTLLNVAYLISYWWPMFDLSSLPISFYVGGGVLLFLILYAIVSRAYRDHYILFFSITTLGFLLFALGVKWEAFAPYFVFVVTKFPIIGSMFRDPNKLLGLMAVGYGVLISFGVVHFFLLLKNKFFHNVIKIAGIVLFYVAFTFYTKPFYHHYIRGFYHPVEVPLEFVTLQEKMNKIDAFDSKVLYMPIADNMTQPSTGVATPFWNNNNNLDGMEKATGDIHIYSSSKNTIFHHEGNDMNITYYMNFLQHLLDNGTSKNMEKLLTPFGVNEYVYRKEYKGQEERQEFNLKLLEEQEGLTLKSQGDIFSLYELKNSLPYANSVKKKIYTTKGLSFLESISNRRAFNFKDYGVIFTSIKRDIGLKGIEEGDYIEATAYDDLLLSVLPQENYILPFEFINHGNAFLRWSKTLVKNSDWMWYLRSQGIENFPYSFDFSSGVAFTFANSMVDLEPYQMQSARGKLVANFDSLLKENGFFKSDNPSLLEVNASPNHGGDQLQIIHGEVVRGDPKNIWQVAKSGMLKAKESNPYKFTILASGRGTNKMHVKVRFYDKRLEEIGISYVVAPSQEASFDRVRMFGEVVSPKNTRYMRMDLLTFQRPEQKIYWWIHDIQIEDMEKFKAPNEFEMNIKSKKEGEYILFARVLMNRVGGEILIENNKKEFRISTKSDTINDFRWIKVGDLTLKEGNHSFNVRNISGFNAINLFALIPLEEIEDLKYRLNSNIAKAKTMIFLEAESDFQYKGPIQSLRTYPALSGGKGITAQEGLLGTEISFLKDAIYTITVAMNGLPKEDSEILVELQNHQTGKKIQRRFDTKNFQKSHPNQITIETDYSKRGFPRSVKVLEDTMDHKNLVEIPGVYLKKGDYQFTIRWDSGVASVSGIENFNKFDTKEIIALFEKSDSLSDPGYSKCETITPDMMRSWVEDDVMHFEFDKTCSIDWYDYASNLIEVKENQEYLISFEAMSKEVRKRHIKVLFLNDKKELTSTAYIEEVEEEDKVKWNQYEQIVLVPKDARYMQLHILCKGNNERKGMIKLKNYSVIPYRKLLNIDSVMIHEGLGSIEEFLTQEIEDKKIHEIKSVDRIDSMKRRFVFENPEHKKTLIRISESPTPAFLMAI
jgi:hypothetical protein